MATKENLPTKQSRSANTPHRGGIQDSSTTTLRPRRVGRLNGHRSGKRLEAVQRAQISPRLGSEKVKESQDKAPRRQSPCPATRPRRYALELWVEIEIRAGM